LLFPHDSAVSTLSVLPLTGGYFDMHIYRRFAHVSLPADFRPDSQFDVKDFNQRTGLAGLDNSLPNAFVNSAIQVRQIFLHCCWSVCSFCLEVCFFDFNVCKLI
jgi:adenosylcobinamide amidohydrolase